MKSERHMEHHTYKNPLKKAIKASRKALFTLIVTRQAAKTGKNCTVNFYSKVTRNTYLSDHVNFNGMVIKGMGTVIIGTYFHSGKDCLILTSNHNYEGDAIPYDRTAIMKDVQIGDFVWFGDRVTILPGVSIGEGAIIQAGAVVVKDIPPCAIAGGNPAQVFKYRDKEHFYRLKSEGKFC